MFFNSVFTALQGDVRTFLPRMSHLTCSRFNSFKSRKTTRSETIRIHAELNQLHQRTVAVFWRMLALISRHSGMLRDCTKPGISTWSNNIKKCLSMAFTTRRFHRREMPKRLLQINWSISRNHIIASFRRDNHGMMLYQPQRFHTDWKTRPCLEY